MKLYKYIIRDSDNKVIFESHSVYTESQAKEFAKLHRDKIEKEGQSGKNLTFEIL